MSAGMQYGVRRETTLLDCTEEMVGKQVGFEVPEIALSLAKHLAVGVSVEDVGELFLISPGDLVELMGDPQFVQVQEVVNAYAQNQVLRTDMGWDAVEDLAVANVVHNLRVNRDPDLALRAAAIANKASRRRGTRAEPIQPKGANVGQRVAFKVTKRFAEKMERLTQVVTETQVVKTLVEDHRKGNLVIPQQTESSTSIHRSERPTFDEVDRILNVTAATSGDGILRPGQAQASRVMREEEVTVEALFNE